MVVLIGTTRRHARQYLNRVIESEQGECVSRNEAVINGDRVIALDGTLEGVCLLRSFGFRNIIIRVLPDAQISDDMRRRINHIKTTREEIRQ